MARNEPPRRPAPERTTASTLPNPELSSERSAKTRSRLPIGHDFGRYRILHELGRGTMGVVFEAHDPSLDRRVALKVLHAHLGPVHATRLTREARAMAQLSHPNVVNVYEVGVVDEQRFIAMELVEGQSLRQWHEQPRPWPAVLDVYVQAGRGLGAAHAHGLVHRDFKPANCLVDEAGRVRVADFGLVAMVQEQSVAEGVEPPSVEDPSPMPSNPLTDRITRAGAVLGTPAYMPPAQRAGAPWDARADQYSFCVSVWEALHGEWEPTRETTSLEGPAPGLVPAHARTPRRLHRALTRGIEPDAERRWPSMNALLHELERCRRSGRRRWLVAGLVLTNLVILGGIWAANRADPPCTGAREHLRGIWDESRAQGVDAAIRASQVAYAADTTAAVRARLSRYADDWVRVHTESCEATHVRGELTVARLEPRVRCLERRRQSLRHAVDQLMEADAEVVEHAVEVVTGLPSSYACMDARTPSAEPPELAEALAMVRSELDRARTRLRAGKYDTGLQEVQAALDRAESLHHEPVLAEARLIRGALYQAMGRYELAEEDLREAQRLAQRSDHASIAAEASTSLTFVTGVPLARYEAAVLLGEIALALAQRVDPEGAREAEAFLAVGQVLANHGHDAEAEARLLRALELLRALPDADPLDLVATLDGLAGAMRRLGRYPDAEHHARDAVALIARELGPQHPAMVGRLANLAAILVDAGEYEAAEQTLGQALDVGHTVLAPTHPALAHAHNNLGALLLSRGHHREAMEELQQALALWRSAPAPEPDRIADVLTNLGVAARGAGRPEEAVGFYEQALARYAEVHEPDHPRVATAELNLGKALKRLRREDEAALHLERARAAFERYGGPEHAGVAQALEASSLLATQQGRHADAVELQRRALAIFEKVYAATPSHPRIARALGVLGRAQTELGRLAQATETLERAQTIESEAEVRTIDRARLGLARAELAWRRDGNTPDARALAQRALDRLEEETGGEADRLRDELERWLAEHPESDRIRTKR